MSFQASGLVFASLCMMAGTVFGAPPDNGAPDKKAPVTLSLADSAWEVMHPDAPKDGPDLFRFQASGRFHYRSVRGVFSYDGARWEAEGDKFEVAVPDVDWRMTGAFTHDTIRGTVIRNGKTTAFEGRRVDPKSYQFPLEEGEAIVTVKLRRYTLDWPYPEPGELEEYLKKDQAPDPKRTGKYFISGFIFEVIAPKEYRGQYVTVHHDGFLASGDPTRIAEPGKEYLVRIAKKGIGNKDFSLCSVDLCIKLAADKRPLNP